MKKTGAQIITKLLEMHGIKTVAGIPGGSILPLYDELNKSSIKHVLVRQEQAGGFIAQGIARTTGLPAVCIATSGPGAMNLLTAIADARADSVPIIAITGQVNTYLIGTDAFQEADTFGLSFPITKHSIMVTKPEELLTVIPEAFQIAINGRPGPVLIDVPRDVQAAYCEFENWPEIKLPSNETKAKVRFQTNENEIETLLNTAVDMLADSEKPVLYLGGGCNSPKAADGLRNFIEKYRLPVVSSLMGIGVVSKTHQDFAGMVGMHGSYSANYAMYNSDLIIACGVRFDDRATGIVSKFCPKAKIIHIDIDAAEINKILTANLSIVAKIEDVIDNLTNKVNLTDKIAKKTEARNNWTNSIQSIKNETTSDICGQPEEAQKNANFKNSVNPRKFITSIPELAEKCGINRKNIIVTTDVGQHQMWTAQYYPVEEPRTFLTSGSLGTMGFGLPAAIGAAIANENKTIICFSGDGSILMNIQELATLAENKLPVIVIIFENGTLGMVYQQQKFLFNKNYSASTFSYAPDLLKIAEGFGIKTADADKDNNWYEKAFDANKNGEPFVVKVRVDPEECVYPYVPGGKSNIDAIR